MACPIIVVMVLFTTPQILFAVHDVFSLIPNNICSVVPVISGELSSPAKTDRPTESNQGELAGLC